MPEPSSATPLQTMPASEFVKRLHDHVKEDDRHYVFWLGAGCSATSGIPAAGTLVRDRWLPKLHGYEADDEDFERWVLRVFPDYEPNAPGALYGQVMNRLFRLPADRQRETALLCKDKHPGFGYAVLAALMARHNGSLGTVLTTNFDDIVADAMYLFGTERPLVIQHDALAGFARPGHVKRPLVVKVHGDHSLNPRHTVEETAALQESMAAGVRGLLQDRGLIFVGYSGNDRGVLETLEGLPETALPFGVWWVSGSEPTGAIRGWLGEREAVWVQSGRFDDLMLLFREEFDLDDPTVEKFSRIVDRYWKTYSEVNTLVEGLDDSAPDTSQLKQAARSVAEAAPTSFGAELEAARAMQTDPDEAERIFEDGIARLPDPRLMSRYASFLASTRRNDDRAEELFERALAQEPDAHTHTTYAVFLAITQRADDEVVEGHFEKALAIDATDSYTLSSYASFMFLHRGDRIRAGSLFEAALAFGPDDFYTQYDYGRFVLAGGERGRARAILEQFPDEALATTVLAAISIEDDDEARAKHLLGPVLRREITMDSQAWSFACVLVVMLAWDDHRQEALRDLAAFVGHGGTMRFRDFTGVLDHARRAGHPDITWLETLANVLHGDADPALLDGWDDWPSAPKDAAA